MNLEVRIVIGPSPFPDTAHTLDTSSDVRSRAARTRPASSGRSFRNRCRAKNPRETARVIYIVEREKHHEDITTNGSRAREIEVGLEEQPDEDGLREGIETFQDNTRKGVPPRRLHVGGRQVTGGQEAHSAKRPRVEIGCVPPPHVRWRSHRRLGLHRQERMLEAGRYRKFNLHYLYIPLRVA